MKEEKHEILIEEQGIGWKDWNKKQQKKKKIWRKQ